MLYELGGQAAGFKGLCTPPYEVWARSQSTKASALAETARPSLSPRWLSPGRRGKGPAVALASPAGECGEGAKPASGGDSPCGFSVHPGGAGEGAAPLPDHARPGEVGRPPEVSVIERPAAEEEEGVETGAVWLGVE